MKPTIFLDESMDLDDDVLDAAAERPLAGARSGMLSLYQCARCGDPVHLEVFANCDNCEQSIEVAKTFQSITVAEALTAKARAIAQRDDAERRLDEMAAKVDRPRNRQVKADR